MDKSNGGTDDAADLFHNAADEQTIHIAAMSLILPRKLCDVLDAIKFAFPTLSSVDPKPASECRERFESRVGITAEIVNRELAELNGIARQMKPLLSDINTPESRAFLEKLDNLGL
jgi:hypothetical protein